jgi:hypothetical protein
MYYFGIAALDRFKNRWVKRFLQSLSLSLCASFSLIHTDIHAHPSLSVSVLLCKPRLASNLISSCISFLSVEKVRILFYKKQ